MQNIIDLFSGAGGLTEGFRLPEFNILAHVEMNKYASRTLALRDVYYQLKRADRLGEYRQFLREEKTYDALAEDAAVQPDSLIINKAIGSETIDSIMAAIDEKLAGREVNGIIGGPPCQAYSTVGRKRNAAKKKNDERIYLYRYYIQFLEHFKPEFFIFENVRGLLSFKDIDGELLFPKMQAEFRHINRNIGYVIDWKLINCSEYGVPQDRKRVILFGQRDDVPKLNFFEKLEELQETSPTVGEVFQDLPSMHAGEVCNYYSDQRPGSYVAAHLRQPEDVLTQNISRPNQLDDLEIYKIAAIKKMNHQNLRYTDLPKRLQKHKNKASFLDRFKALPQDGNSQTIVAHIAKDGHYFIHPDVSQNRSITVREAARIQTFSDDFYFQGPRTEIFKQIGNAVPPYFARKLAKTILCNK